MCLIRTANELDMKRLRANQPTNLNSLFLAGLCHIAKGEI